jgi:hypothetical protein
VLYLKKHVGKNVLHLLNKLLIENIPKLQGKNVTNKIGKRYAITKMIDVFIPMEYGIEIFEDHAFKSCAN